MKNQIKFLISFILLCLCFLTCNKKQNVDIIQKKVHKYQSDNYKEIELIKSKKIKSLNIYQCEYKNGHLQSQIPDRDEEYNKRGQDILTIFYSYKGIKYSELQYFYDSLNRICCIFTYDDYHNKSKIFELVYKDSSFIYDSVGNDLSDARYDPNGFLLSKDILLYSDSIIARTRYNSDNIIQFIDSSFYDSSYNKIKEVYYNSNGKMERMYTFKHDNIGNKIEQIWYDSSKNIKDRFNYKYNEKNQLIQEFHSWDLGDYKEEYEYNDAGLIISVKEYKNDKIEYIRKYEYEYFN